MYRAGFSTWDNSGSTRGQSDSICPLILGRRSGGPERPVGCQPAGAVVVVDGPGSCTGEVDWTTAGEGGIPGAVTGWEAK